MKKKVLAGALSAALLLFAANAFTDNEVGQLQARADRGEPAAMLELGRGYLGGDDALAKDVDAGVAMLERVVAAGGREAAFAHTALGQHYEASGSSPAAHAKMLHHYRHAASLGDVIAQERLGRILLDIATRRGHDPAYVEELRANALALLTHAANARSTEAMFTLGVAYQTGTGLEANKTEAERWLTQAASSGHRDAAFLIGSKAIESPESEEYKPISGRHYLTIAAQAGHARAQYLLAQGYHSGDHWPANEAQAKEWAGSAAQRRVPGAQALLTSIEAGIEERERVAQAERDRQRAEEEASAAVAAAEAAAAREAERAAHRAAQAELASQQVPAESPPAAQPSPRSRPTFSNSLVIEVARPTGALEDQVQSLMADLRQANEINQQLRIEISSLRENLARVETERDGLVARVQVLESDLQLARTSQTPTRSARNPDGEQLNSQGLEAFHRGDLRGARRFFSRAADAGNLEGINNLAMMTLQGQGVPVNVEEAIRLFRSAADAGHPTAAENLGHIYHSGLGVPADAARARAWFQRAEQLVRAAEESGSAMVAGR
mgnify:CR=1 FL=1|jgi:TPR repeat protein